MKKLDEWIEYKIYELSKEEVLKIPKSLLEIIWTNISWHRKMLLNPLRLVKNCGNIDVQIPISILQ